MQYTILVYEGEADFAARTDAEHQESYWGAFGAYSQALKDAGVLVGGGALLPGHAGTTVRLRGGSRHVQDGPYADTKEQLGGYFVVEAPDLDAALDWAARCPAAASGAVEVRPNLPPMQL
jgi:hypothetical protein